MKYIDLSHQLTNTTPVYPGDPPVEILTNNNVTHDGFCSHTVTMGTHVGTHIDAPAHMIENGKDISDYPVSHFIGNAVVVNVKGKSRISARDLEGVNLSPGDIVILYTGRNLLFQTEEYFTGYPEIAADFAEKLVEAQIKILGMDQASPDHAPFTTHKILLSHDILIIENLTNVEQLLQSGKITVYALPLSNALDAAQVRVVAQIE